jgi:glyoxylase-like metal-dependent hydrolase (beta-lactamase superfamily II)
VATTLSTGISYVDLNFQGAPHVIATAVLRALGDVALVDPGPASALPTLRQELAHIGIAIADVSAVLLTHIHLDHAGACGSLAAENPRLRVYVHDVGAPHLVDPSKLLASATRLYGDQMDALWGEVRPVPAARITTVGGGERLDVGGRRLEVAYTPGHASHHVSYFSDDAGIAFVGDTAGIRRPESDIIVPPTPPPDVDVDAWDASLARIDAWQPETLFVTHFGPCGPPSAHLADMRARLHATAELAKRLLGQKLTPEAREARFVEQMRIELRRRVGDDVAQAYEVAARFDLSWRGLARYWDKRA